MNIYISGTIGIKSAKKLYDENSSFLHERFSSFFIKQIEELFEKELDNDLQEQIVKKQITQAKGENAPDFLLANDDECIYISTIADGGILGALWKACSELKCGCEVDIKKIPIRQEVIEISELFGENPYEADSSGCLLLICDAKSVTEGHKLCKQPETVRTDTLLNEYGQPVISMINECIERADAADDIKLKISDVGFVKIGETTSKKDRVVINGENRRFLTPPQRQQKDIDYRKKLNGK